MPQAPARRLWAITLLAGVGLVLAACGGDDDGPASTDEPAPPAPAAQQSEPDTGGDEASAPASEDDDDEAEPEVDAADGGTYTAALRGVAADLEDALETIADSIEGAGSAGDALSRLEAGLPGLVAALRGAVDGVAALDPPAGLRTEHERLVAGLEAIVDLEEQLLARVEAGDAAGALARAESIAAQQTTLEASLSAEMRQAAGPLLGIAGALGFLPLGAGDLAPSSAAALPPLDADGYLAPLDFPGSERLVTLDPLVVGEAVLITGQWSVPEETTVRELLDVYENALRGLGASGEAQRIESAVDGAVTVGVEHPFGSVIVMLGAGEGGSHLVSVTGSFPAEE